MSGLEPERPTTVAVDDASGQNHFLTADCDADYIMHWTAASVGPGRGLHLVLYYCKKQLS